MRLVFHNLAAFCNAAHGAGERLIPELTGHPCHLSPEFQQLDEALRRYLSEVTTRITREEVHKDVSEATEVNPTTSLPSRST